MALATLRLEDSDESRHVLVADTGTSSHYRIHLGKEVRREEGLLLLDGPYWSSPLRSNPRAGRHLDTRVHVELDAALVTRPGTLAQVESCRGPDGRGPAYSRPVRLPGYQPTRRAAAMSMSLTPDAVTSLALRPARTVPARTAESCFSRPASIADLIASVVQAAAPAVLGMLGPTTGTSSGTGTGTGTDPTSALLTQVLRTVLGALAHPPQATPPAPPAAAIPAPAAAPPPAPALALASTSAIDSRQVNRLTGQTPDLAAPMIFGIDDALIAAVAGPVLSSVVGPVIQLLPQLVNAANQAKLSRQALTNQQVSDLLSQVDRSTLMQQLIAARSMPVNPGVVGSGPSDADLAALQALLASSAAVPAPAGTAAAPGAVVSTPASIEDPPARASRAVLSATTGPLVTRLGAQRVVFVADQALGLRFRLDVGASGPTSPLPRAVLVVTVREPGADRDLFRRSDRLTLVDPGEEITVRLSQSEVAGLPVDVELEVLTALRWPARTGTYQATCARRLTLASRVQVKDRGALVGEPVELTDMSRFRSFWNQVWSSPTASAEPGSLPLWGLDVTMRYSVVPTATDRGNGLMESRLQSEPTSQGLRAQTSGRLRSGLETSVHELNKLLPLWPGHAPLSAEELAAFAAPGWLAGHGGDAIVRVRLEGKRGTRGLLWVVPVVALRTFTLARSTEVDSFGQVVGTEDRVVRFPVIEKIRILGLSSLRDAEDEGEGAEVGTPDSPATYRFDGYDVIHHQLVGLEPAQPLPRGR